MSAGCMTHMVHMKRHMGSAMQPHKVLTWAQSDADMHRPVCLDLCDACGGYKWIQPA